MPASHLYQFLIENPTKNVQELQRNRAGRTAVQVGVHMTPQELGMLPEQRLLGPGQRTFGQQFDLDAAMWYGAIKTGPYALLLRKIFHIFYYAGVLYNRGNSIWDDWSENRFGNVASLLSHGQRVLVQIPSWEKGGSLLWAWLNNPDEIPWRTMATHGQSPMNEPADLIKGRHQYVKEKKGWGQSFSGRILHRHYGVNVALGGDGNRNPFSATNDDKVPSFKPIKADGCNGQVYINYMAPNSPTAVRGMLIGCENAASAKTNPHTKASHGLGAAQSISVCGGKKWNELKCGPLAEYNGFICDLIDDPRSTRNLDWLISAPLFDPDWLDRPTIPVVPTAAIAHQMAGAGARRAALGYADDDD